MRFFCLCVRWLVSFFCVPVCFIGICARDVREAASVAPGYVVVVVVVVVVGGGGVGVGVACSCPFQRWWWW